MRADEGADRVDDVWADEGTGAEEDGPVAPCWCGSRIGGGRAGDATPGRKTGRKRLGGGGWAQADDYRRREQSGPGGRLRAGG
jgi:hypothetical protein